MSGSAVPFHYHFADSSDAVLFVWLVVISLLIVFLIFNYFHFQNPAYNYIVIILPLTRTGISSTQCLREPSILLACER